MSRTRIKICGITRGDDAQAAVAAGADALGLVFYEPSPRAVTIEQAREICRFVPPLVSLVALFVDAPVELVGRVCDELPVDVLQFHGNEPESDCRQYDRPWMKAIRVSPDTCVPTAMERWPGAGAILLDTYRSGVPGGTGESFDWSQVPQGLDTPLVLAGGLGADNVATAVQCCRPYAVDVSGGVEASPGIKDARKIEQFIAAVKAADENSQDKL